MEPRSEHGAALVVVLMLTVLVAAMASALVMTTTTDTLVTSNFSHALRVRSAADAAAEFAISELAATARWDDVLTGVVQSRLRDGSPSGTRTIQGTETINLSELVNAANCGRTTTCTQAQMDLATADRPWGPNNPRWSLFAYGPIRAIVPGESVDSPDYAVVMVADDGSENDGDPMHDGLQPGNPGAGVLLLRAAAFGPRGAHSTLEVTLGRSRDVAGPAGVRVRSWREVP